MSEEKKRILYGFGRYQGKELDWLVLDQETGPDGKMLVLSRNSVAEMQFGGGTMTMGSDEWYASSQWHESDVRRWLGGTFLKDAFTEQERKCILETNVPCVDMVVTNEKAWRCKVTDDGKDTKDRLFLLSKENASRYMKTAKERICGKGWWLRDWYTVGGWSNYDVAYIDKEGFDKHGVGYLKFGVRPAMWIRFSEDQLDAKEKQRKSSLLKEKEELHAQRENALKSIPPKEKKEYTRLRKEWEDAKAETEKKRMLFEEAYEKWEKNNNEIRKVNKELESLSGIFFLRKNALKSTLKQLKQTEEELDKQRGEASRIRYKAEDVQKAAEKAYRIPRLNKYIDQVEEIERRIAEADEELKNIQ